MKLKFLKYGFFYSDIPKYFLKNMNNLTDKLAVPNILRLYLSWYGKLYYEMGVGWDRMVWLPLGLRLIN
jgi:hypothetical protein